MSTITDIRTVGITIADQDEAIAFYRDTLGFDVRLDVDGPTRWVAALGYAGWGVGQLEQEMCGNGWFTTPGNDELLYDCDVNSRWTTAFRSAGVDPRLLTADFGTA